MAFRVHQIERFRTTKLDIIVCTIVITVFIATFPFNGIQMITYQFFLGPFIMTYEMIVLIIFDGKRKGRELPWRLYTKIFYLMFKQKIREGIKEYHEWKKTNT